MLDRYILVILIISSVGREIICEDGQNKTGASCTGQNYAEDFQKSPICYCDSDCVLYGDCCDDTTNSSFMDFHLNSNPNCQRFGQQSYPSFWTVTSCLEGESLMNDGISLPVMDENGILFASDQIAHCNTVLSFSLMDIHVILSREICDVDLIYSSLEKPFMELFIAIMNSDCKFVINSKHDRRLTPRLCVDWPEEEMERNLSSECKIYEKPIRIPPVVYKNTHCFEDLNGFPLPDDATDVGEVYQHNETSLHIQFTDSRRQPSYKENGVCTENVMDNCHRRLIKNWNHTIEIIMTVKSTGDMIVEEFKKTMEFIETINLNPFTSEIKLLNGESFTVVSTPLCKHKVNKDEPIKIIAVCGISFTFTIVIGVYFSTLKKPDDDDDSE
ncbi:uncharacterized protein LOC134242437 [Saccostrea cucullata]|uniref:uncharacterized protein LOC134242437 n=1 Tax=Saccostrea cuccullata TaxID=36930 RepID=UPI002ED04F08